jgi:hypothetical protein
LRIEEAEPAPAVPVAEAQEAPEVRVEEVWQVPPPVVAADPEPAPVSSGEVAVPEPAPVALGEVAAAEPAPVALGEVAAAEPAPVSSAEVAAPEPAPVASGEVAAPEPAPAIAVEPVDEPPDATGAAPAPSDSAEEAPPEVDPAAAPEPEEGALETGEGELVASLPPEVERPTPVEPGVQQFLDDWARSIQELDYGLYKRLGFADSRRKFKRRFEGHEDSSVRFEQIEAQRAPGGDLRLSVLMIYSYTERGSRKVQERERKIVLHPAEEGLRYVEAWN